MFLERPNHLCYLALLEYPQRAPRLCASFANPIDWPNVWCLRIDHLSQARPYLPAITRPRREEFVGIFFVPFAHEETFRRLLSNLLAMEHENSWGRSSSAPGVGISACLDDTRFFSISRQNFITE